MMVLMLLMLSAGVGQGTPETDLDGLVRREVPDLLDFYRHLHARPELSFQEKQTASEVAARLRSCGFEVTEGVGRYPDGGSAFGVVGVLRNGEGPTVLLRTDLDALPVAEKTGLPYASRVRSTIDGDRETPVMHACGHDMHMSSFLGTARLLASQRDRWQGTLVAVGQPAEERGAGAGAMLADGLYSRFPRPDYALALHVSPELPAGQVGFRPGFALASVDSVNIRVRGVGGHGASPHKTHDPVVLASQIVLALQTIVSRTVSPLDPAVVTVGSIHGGAKHNVIPDSVDLQLTVRTYKPEVRNQVLDSIRRISRYTAEAAGLPENLLPVVEVLEQEHTPSTYNDPALTERLVQAWRRQLGASRVVEVDPVMAGEDFSRYRLEDDSIPTCIFWLGSVPQDRFDAARQSGDSLPPLHSPLFAPDPQPTLTTGIEATAAAVLELLRRP